MSPPVDVVILTWNDPAQLAMAVDSALESVGVGVQVVVVDNGSEPPAVVPGLPTVRLLREERNRGLAAGRNRGVAAGSAPYVCFLDSNARLHPRALKALIEPLTRDLRIALAVPVFEDQPAEASAGRAPGALRKLGRGLGLVETYAPVPRDPSMGWWDVDFGIGACQLFRRAAFDRVGGLDESIFYGPEDVDFCLRLKTRGWRAVQVADARCEHPPRRSNRRLVTRQGMAHLRQILRYLWRHRLRPRLRWA